MTYIFELWPFYPDFSFANEMDEELKNLQLDKPARGKVKIVQKNIFILNLPKLISQSQDELRKHTLDNQFENRPIERSLFLLT